MKYSDATPDFYAWQPSTWPAPPELYNADFRNVLSKIFHDSLLIEIKNVISDAPSLEHRGHVVALSIMCAIDTLASYAFKSTNEACSSCGRGDRVGPNYKEYIETFFPSDYQPYANEIYKLYRNSLTHSWNLFQAGMLPGNESIRKINGAIIFGLRHLFDALEKSVDVFLEKLTNDSRLQEAALKRYRELKNSARP